MADEGVAEVERIYPQTLTNRGLADQRFASVPVAPSDPPIRPGCMAGR